MHERSLVRQVLRQVTQLMVDHDCGHVRKVRLSVGEFSGVEPELLEFAFDEMVSDTPLQGAVLELETVPLEAQCDVCGNQFAVERFVFICPVCGSPRVSVVRGEQLMLESLVMEEVCYG
jgi:hydrogenase nickel incorporation protein HypA/HybF